MDEKYSLPLKIISLFLLSFGSKSIFGVEPYIVKRGDTLSQIVSKLTDPPPSLYGNGGRLERVRRLNSISDSNLIFPGDVIIFSNSRAIGSETPSLQEVPLDAPVVVDEKQLKVVITGGILTKRVDSSGSGDRTTILSSFGYGFDLTLEYLLGEDLTMFLDISYASYNFAAGSSKQIEDKKGVVTSFKIGSTFSKGGYLFGGKLGQNSEISTVATNSTTIKIEPLSIYSFSIFGNKKIYSYKKVDLIPELTVGTLQFGRTTNSIGVSGYLGKLSIKLSYKKNWGEINSLVFYKYQSIKHDSWEDKNKETGVKISVGRSF